MLTVDTRNPEPCTPEPCTLKPAPCTLHPEPQALNPTPSGTETVVLTAGEDVRRNGRVLVFIPRAFGLVLPYGGVRRNELCIEPYGDL